MTKRKTEMPLASDILFGAEAIATFMFGTSEQRRRVYNLADGGLPVFRLGTMICARKSVLLTWIEAQEISATAPLVRSTEEPAHEG